MANRIKGITVEINGNTTSLQKSLQSVDKNIKNTQTQLKDVEKLLLLKRLQAVNAMASSAHIRLKHWRVCYLELLYNRVIYGQSTPTNSTKSL